MQRIDQLADLALEKRESLGPLTTTSGESGLSKSYLRRMFVIVSRSYAGVSHPPTDGEKQIKAADWSEMLFAVGVPERRLFEVYERALRDHTSTYAINGYDLKLAWFRIRDEEAAAAVEAAMERRRRAVHHYDCERCGGQRWVFEDGMKRPCEGE